MVEMIASLIAIFTFLFGITKYLLKKIKILRSHYVVLIDCVDDLIKRISELEEKSK